MAITVTALAISAVKATQIRAVDAIELDAHGARGDRAFYIVDSDNALVNGKRLGVLQQVVADYDPDGGELALRFPDGHECRAPVRLGAALQTTFFGTPRELPLLEGPWSQALTEFAGQPLRLVATESGVDRGREGAISIMSRASLTELARIGEPIARAERESPVDGRRFRMLIEVDGVEAHEEDSWVGCELALGRRARVRVHGNIGRCVTTTRSPDSGEVTLPTLKMLASYRLTDIETTERLPFGVHGEVLEGGPVRVGDAVRVLARTAAG